MRNGDSRTGHGSTVVVLSFIASVVLATGALVITSGDGAQAASELVVRFSTLIFIGSLVAEPLASLFPAGPLVALAHQRANLRLSFVATFAFSLACILMPATLAGESLPASAAVYVGLNSLILVTMLFPTNKAAMRLVGTSGWRAIQLIATAYFGMSFSVSALIHVIRNDGFAVWHPLVLSLFIGTFGVNVAARVHKLSDANQRPVA